jgi:hypothetical protein
MVRLMATGFRATSADLNSLMSRGAATTMRQSRVRAGLNVVPRSCAGEGKRMHHLVTTLQKGAPLALLLARVAPSQAETRASVASLSKGHACKEFALWLAMWCRVFPACAMLGHILKRFAELLASQVVNRTLKEGPIVKCQPGEKR